MNTFDIYLSPEGSDHAEGSLSNPMQSMEGALERLRQMDQAGEQPKPANVYLRGGHYALTKPVCVNRQPGAPVCFQAYQDEKPCLSGGRRIENLQVETVNGLEMWTAQIANVASGEWFFRELFVNGERRGRTRLPKTGFYTMEDVPAVQKNKSCWEQLFNGSHQFRFKQGDITALRNPQDVDIIAHHFWVDERMPIERIDMASRIVDTSVRSVFVLLNDNDKDFVHYYLENTFEGLSEPGEWYLDRSAGKLYYIPLKGESIEETVLIAPAIQQFLIMDGNPEQEQYIEDMRFQGLTFEYADWCHTKPEGRADSEYFAVKGFDTAGLPYATAPQGAAHVPGTISIRGAKNCAIENCSIRHTGFYGIELRDGCSGIQLTGNEIFDTGAGGIRVNGSANCGQPQLQTHSTQIYDNHIHKGGQVFLCGIGVLLMHTAQNKVCRNTIHDYYYTGISSGWIWGFSESISKENLFEGNHIYDLGKGLISDMGGIYLLGIQAGTVIRGNHIHDVKSCNYGGWGIYLDEGCSYVIVEQNLVHHVSNQCFNQHYGRENMIRNNIFAFSDDGLISVNKLNLDQAPYCPVSAYTQNALTFAHNLVVSDGKPIHIFSSMRPEDKHFTAYGNIYWNTAMQEQGVQMMAESRFNGENRTLSLEAMQALGFESASLYVDTGLVLTEDGYGLPPDSPAYQTGFKPFTIGSKNAGPNTRGNDRT